MAIVDETASGTAAGSAAPFPPTVVVVMGVSGSGKTTVAAGVAAKLGCPYQEGDDLHPQANVDKMHSGIPLTDDDRWPWLDRIAAVIDGWREEGQSGVLSCSALKRAYRDVIIGNRPDVALVYLHGPKELIFRRMAARHEHFMPTGLLDSQFATLEEPTEDEHPISVPIGGGPIELVDMVIAALRLRAGQLASG
ncbi:MAG: gluconokinase [Acetobacteraceae bacterium]|nr:gluconokinase [Acetobacteraceae bacterium]